MPPEPFQIQMLDIGNVRLANLYSPPDSIFPRTIIETIENNQTPPVIITGDFNAQNQRWGSGATNNNGRIVSAAINNTDLVILNDGSATRQTNPNQHKSAPDLTLCSQLIAPVTAWKVYQYPSGSDHFPIIIDVNMSHIQPLRREETRTRWNEDKIDWTVYNQYITEALHLGVESNFQEIVSTTLSKTTHKTTQVKRKIRFPLNPPWWTEECPQLIKKRKEALRVYRNDPSNYNFTEYKRKVAVTRRRLKEIKKKRVTKILRNLPFHGKRVNIQHPESSVDWAEKILNNLAPPWTMLPIDQVTKHTRKQRGTAAHLRRTTVAEYPQKKNSTRKTRYFIPNDRETIGRKQSDTNRIVQPSFEWNSCTA